MELDLQVSPEEIMSIGRWSWAAKVGLLSLRVVPQQQCNGHCPCDSAQARQLKQQLLSALVAGQWRGDTAFHCSGGGENRFNVSVGSDGQSHKTVSTKPQPF